MSADWDGVTSFALGARPGHRTVDQLRRKARDQAFVSHGRAFLHVGREAGSLQAKRSIKGCSRKCSPDRDRPRHLLADAAL